MDLHKQAQESLREVEMTGLSHQERATRGRNLPLDL